jgi:hypothetical protein
LKPRAEPRQVSAPRRSDIDCELAYTLPAETHFLFQVHAPHGMDQAILSESLALTPTTCTPTLAWATAFCACAPRQAR